MKWVHSVHLLEHSGFLQCTFPINSKQFLINTTCSLPSDIYARVNVILLFLKLYPVSWKVVLYVDPIRVHVILCCTLYENTV